MYTENEAASRLFTNVPVNLFSSLLLSSPFLSPPLLSFPLLFTLSLHPLSPPSFVFTLFRLHPLSSPSFATQVGERFSDSLLDGVRGPGVTSQRPKSCRIDSSFTGSISSLSTGSVTAGASSGGGGEMLPSAADVSLRRRTSMNVDERRRTSKNSEETSKNVEETSMTKGHL